MDKHKEEEEERGKKRQQLDMRKFWACQNLVANSAPTAGKRDSG